MTVFEHGGQIALVTLFRPVASHTVGAGDALGAPLLTGGPQVQVVLQQAVHQLPGVLGELILKLGMGQLTATRIGKSSHNLLEQLPGPIKRSDRGLRQP